MRAETGMGAALALALLPFSVQGQILDRVAFEVQLRARGVTVDPATAKPQQASFQATAYVVLTFVDDGAEPTYHFLVYDESAPGVYTPGDERVVDVVEGEELAFFDTFIGFQSGPAAVAAYQTARILLKRDAQGALVSARMRTLSSQLAFATLDTATMHPFYGRWKLKGRSVPLAELPFTPIDFTPEEQGDSHVGDAGGRRRTPGPGWWRGPRGRR